MNRLLSEAFCLLALFAIQTFVRPDARRSGSASTLVASEGGGLRGGVVLALLGLGAAIPLAAVACASRSSFLRARESILAHMERVRCGFAVLLGGMGVAILTGADDWVESPVLAWLPDAGVDLTIGV